MDAILKLTKYLTLAAVVIAIFLLSTVALIIAQFPEKKELKSCMTTKMYSVYLCPNSANYVRLKNISPFLLKTIVLTEDSSFWTHKGFDFDELEKSLKKNFEKGKYARGGSTISQQLARNLFLSEEKTMLRKFKEAIITIQLEKYLTKSEILEMYLNVVHLGKNIYGVTQAAQFYFQKKPSDLNVIESMFLAFLLPSPEKYAQSFYKKKLTPFARKRLNQILSSLHTFNRIDDSEFLIAKNELDRFLNNDPNEPILQDVYPEELEPAEND